MKKFLVALAILAISSMSLAEDIEITWEEPAVKDYEGYYLIFQKSPTQSITALIRNANLKKIVLQGLPDNSGGDFTLRTFVYKGEGNYSMSEAVQGAWITEAGPEAVISVRALQSGYYTCLPQDGCMVINTVEEETIIDTNSINP